jgi:hypothetical protein
VDLIKVLVSVCFLTPPCVGGILAPNWAMRIYTFRIGTNTDTTARTMIPAERWCLEKASQSQRYKSGHS